MSRSCLGTTTSGRGRSVVGLSRADSARGARRHACKRDTKEQDNVRIMLMSSVSRGSMTSMEEPLLMGLSCRLPRSTARDGYDM